MARVYEKEFLTHLGKVFTQKGHSFFKIPDSYGMERFGIKRPFDAFSVMWGKAVAIEAKFLKAPQAFGRRHVRPHQIDALVNVSRSGGLGIIALEVRMSRGNYRWFAWEIESFLLRTSSGSIKKNELLEEMPMASRKARQWYSLDVFEGKFFPGEEETQKARRKKRKCLSCGKMFSSKSKGNRLCWHCGHRPDRDIVLY